MRGLEHCDDVTPEIFEDDYVLDLHEFNLDDFCLEYIYKFIVESRIPKIRLFGDARLNIR